jgi:Meckel syndrome type 1 protein
MMLQQIFGTQLDFPVRLGIAFLVIAVLLGATVMLVRAIGGRRATLARGRSGPRLTIVDSLSVDARRRLMLVRRDDVEHLILVGGTADIVVEADIGKPVTAAQPVLVREGQVRESVAPPAQIRSPQAAPALAREAPAPRLAAARVDALPPAETDGTDVPAPEEAPAQEIRRPMPARRPLPRSDGTLSGRPVASAPAPAARPSLSRGAPSAALGRSTSGPTQDLAAERRPTLERPVAAARAPEPEVEAIAPASAAVEPPRAAVVAAGAAPVPRPAPDIDDIAQKLDLALSEPAAEAPRLSLADLLDEEPASAPAAGASRIEIDLVSELAAELEVEVAGTKAAADAADEMAAHPDAPDLEVAAEAPPMEAPKVDVPHLDAPHLDAPKVEAPAAAPSAPEPHSSPADAPPVPAVERPRERLRDIRPVLPPAAERTERPRLEPAMPRLEGAPRPEFAPREPAPREPGQRPREFAFRTGDGAPRPPREAPRLDTPRLEALRRPAGGERPPAERPPAVTRLREPTRRDGERRAEEGAARTAPLAPPRRWESPPVSARPDQEAPAFPKGEKSADPAPAPANDPFNDLDSEMANLLGRGSGR